MQTNGAPITILNRQVLFITIMLLIPAVSSAQQSDTSISNINKRVQAIEEHKNLTEHKHTHKEKGINKEFTWFRDDNGIAKMTCDWTTSSSERTEKTTQVFYLYKEKLISANEMNVYVYNKNDTIGDGANYYFEDNKLIHFTSLGHGKYDSDDWDAEKEILKAFRNIRKKILTIENKRLNKTASKRQQ